MALVPESVSRSIVMSLVLRLNRFQPPASSARRRSSRLRNVSGSTTLILYGSIGARIFAVFADSAWLPTHSTRCESLIVITLTFPEHAPELVTFTTSPLAEAAHSWHVLTDPGHHALHMHWVRQYRTMASPVRRGLRMFAFAVQRFVPAFLEAPGGSLYESFDEQLSRFAALETRLVAAELAQKLIDPRWLGLQVLVSEQARIAARAE